MIRTFWHPNPNETAPKFWAYCDSGPIYFGAISRKPTIQAKSKGYGEGKFNDKLRDGYMEGPSVESEADLTAILNAFRALHAKKTANIAVVQPPGVSLSDLQRLSRSLGLTGTIQWNVEPIQLKTPATLDTEWTW